MPKKRYSAKEIMHKLRETDVLLAQGKTITETCKQLGVTMDSPEVVALAFIRFLKSGTTAAHIGWPERFFVWLNKVAPQLVSNALAKQLPTIKKFAAH